MKWLICLFKGHQEISEERKDEIEYALKMYGWDVWGTDAFSNIQKMKRLKAERDSCTRCKRLFTNARI